MSVLFLLAALQQNDTVPGELRSYSTARSIGIEWDLEGDADHDATCRTSFRPKGSGPWKEALPLFRTDFFGWYAETKADRAYNMFAGSVLFLVPGTAYEVKLDLSDPDGGSVSRTVEVATRDVPRFPRDGRTWHAVPGEGGGKGTAEEPFRGLKEAQAAARPGDVVLLGAGAWPFFTFTQGGEPGKPLVWKAAGEAVFPTADVEASHLWFEGLTFRKAERDVAFKAQAPAKDLVVRRCSFLGYQYSIVCHRGSLDWTIEDNVIEGSEDPLRGDLSGEGVELNHSGGHVVAHNRISRVADGISYCHRNCDLYGNDIFDVSDDGLEPDYGYANNRMWGNRLTNSRNAALSFQPMYCGPWYFLRNQVIGAGEVFKFRVQDRFVLANNTFVSWGHTASYMHHALSSLSRNNLYIEAGPREGREWSPIWLAIHYRDSGKYVVPPVWTPDWRTDVDYDGFDWGEAKTPFTWEGGKRRFADLASFSAAVGIEKNAVRVKKEEIFARWTVPPARARVEPHDLVLKAGSNAVDAGAPLPNLAEDFAGKAPDLGSHELGLAPAHYGPRPEAVDVFVSGREGYHTFRIPSAIATSKGTLLAFAEGRKKSRSDTGDIDLVLKRSTDGGRTWGPLQVVWDDGENTCGNPCPVVDRDTGTVWLLLTHNLGRDTEQEIVEGKSEGTRTAWVSRSDDDGLSWSKPVEITRDVKKPEWTWYATGPGVAIQAKSGRLVVPCDAKYEGGKKGSSHVIFSDDHGRSWKPGGAVGDTFGESQVVELADGALVLNMRNMNSPKRERGIATSRDGGLTWSAPGYDAALVEPVCQASVLRFGADAIAFSNPASAKTRSHMTVRLSFDEGKTWPAARLLWEGPSAYSCLAPDGCLFEAGDRHAYERIVWVRLSRAWIEGR